MRGHYIKNRRDLNEPQIFDIIRSHGIQVYPTDQPADAVCGFSGMTFLVEVKNGPKAKTLEALEYALEYVKTKGDPDAAQAHFQVLYDSMGVKL